NDSGIWEFYSHTHKLHHLDGDESRMLNTKQSVLEEDLKESRAFLQYAFDEDIDAIAYPFGQADDAVVETAEDVGFDYGFSLEEKEMRPDNDPYFIPRILVSEDAFENLVKTWEGFEE